MKVILMRSSICSQLSATLTMEENQKVLDAVARALKPGGKFLIDLLNTLRIIRNFLPQSWDELSDGTVALTKRDYNLLTGNIEELRTYIDPDGEQARNSARLAVVFLY